jgi:hypothetical protein
MRHFNQQCGCDPILPYNDKLKPRKYIFDESLGPLFPDPTPPAANLKISRGKNYQRFFSKPLIPKYKLPGFAEFEQIFRLQGV